MHGGAGSVAQLVRVEKYANMVLGEEESALFGEVSLFQVWPCTEVPLYRFGPGDLCFLNSSFSTAYCHKKGQFLYTTTSQAVTHRFPVDSLAITALHFVPQILCLLIGYSLGGFQLYDVQKMVVLHSSPCPKVPSPVTHFVYQEPENDPKNNVYIWVARGNPAFVR